MLSMIALFNMLCRTVKEIRALGDSGVGVDLGVSILKG